MKHQHEKNERLDKLESLALAATAGPWVTVPLAWRMNCSDGKPPAFKNGRWVILPEHDTHRMPLAEVDHADDHCAAAREHAENDARFIAAASPAAILDLIELVREEEAERERFENLFAATCETLGRVKRELGMPDAAIGTEPERAAELRQERDALAAHVERYRAAYAKLTNAECTQDADTGEYLRLVDRNLMDKFDAIADETYTTSLARIKAEWQAELLEAITDDMRSKSKELATIGVLDALAAKRRRQAEEADQ